MIRIIYMTPPEGTPSFYKDEDGMVSFDLNPSTRIVISRLFDDFSTPGEIRQDAARSIKLPATDKNRFLFGQVGNPIAIGVNNSKEFQVQVLNEDSVLPLNALQVEKTIDQQGGYYECSLKGIVNDWYVPLSTMKLNEVDLGSAVMTKNYFASLFFSSRYAWQDGDDPVFPHVVNYGKWLVQQNRVQYEQAQAQATFSDLRFWFSPKAILEAAFCQVGYKLVVPMMDSDYFRSTWNYLLDENFETANYDPSRPRKFEVELDKNLLYALIWRNYDGIITFLADDIVEDQTPHLINRYTSQPTPERILGSFYNGGFLGTIECKGNIQIAFNNSSSWISADPTPFTMKFSIRKSARWGYEDSLDLIAKSEVLEEFVYVRNFGIPASWTTTFPISLSTELQNFYPSHFYFFYFEISHNFIVMGSGQAVPTSQFENDIYFEAGFEFNNVVQKQIIEYGDTVEYGKLLDSTISVIDLLKGVAHPFNWKVKPFNLSKRVEMYPEFPMSLQDGTVAEGFFLSNTDNPIEASGMVAANSKQEENKASDLGRNVILKFKDSTDAFIKLKGQDKTLHAKAVDLGENYKDSTNTIQNPLFEPLIADFDLSTSGFLIQGGGGPLANAPTLNYYPHMWESSGTAAEAPERGFVYAPRMGIAHLTALGLEILGINRAQIIFEDSPLIYTPFAQIFPSSIRNFTSSTLPSTELTKTLVYGNGVNSNLLDQWQAIYKRSVEQAYNGLLVRFLIKLSSIDFSRLDFRRKWHIVYKSKLYGELDMYLRLAEVKEFVAGEHITTPIYFVPDTTFKIECE